MPLPAQPPIGRVPGSLDTLRFRYNALDVMVGGEDPVPSQRSARVTRRRTLRNRPIRTALRTIRTKADRAMESGASDEAVAAVSATLRTMDRAAGKGVIHRNKAARLKSRLSRRFNAARQATQP